MSASAIETLETAVEQTRILIVDDHTTFAELLNGALDREGDLHSVGYANSAATGVEQYLALRPDIVIMDYHLPDGSGITAAARILAYAPHARIVMLTGDPTAEALEEAAAIGICAFLPKDGSLATMLETLRYARAGCMVVHPLLLAQTARKSKRSWSGRGPVLTPRELDVLRLMAQGKDVRANARSLGISPNTCRGYVKAILAKLESHSQLEAVAVAIKFGLLTTRGDV